MNDIKVFSIGKIVNEEENVKVGLEGNIWNQEINLIN